MAVARQENDRRIARRDKFDCEVQYLAAGTDHQCTGILDNLSHTGALIWAPDQLGIGTELVVIVEPQEDGQLPIFIGAQVVRVVEGEREGMFGYGCVINSNSEEPL